MTFKKKGDGWGIAHNDYIYVFGTVEGERYELSTKRKSNDKKYIIYLSNRGNAHSVLLQLIEKKKEKSKPKEEKDPPEMFDSFARKIIDGFDVKPATLKDYESKFERFILPKFGLRPFEYITVETIEDWMVDMRKQGETKSVIFRTFSLFKRIVTRAYKYDRIEKNPFDKVETPPQGSPARIKYRAYTEQEVNLLIERAEGWFKVFLVVAFGTGRRTGQVMALKWEDIDFDRNIIKIQRRIAEGKPDEEEDHKFKKEDIIMLPLVAAVLKEYYNVRPSDEWLFVTRSGDHYGSSQSIREAHFLPLLGRLGIPDKSLYSSRHTFVSLLYNDGIDKSWISRMVGHRRVSTTEDFYAQMLGKMEDKTFEAAKANNLLFGLGKERASNDD